MSPSAPPPIGTARHGCFLTKRLRPLFPITTGLRQMILRRVASALKRQDWVVVLIEFVLVIAGVLIALQINNWNEATGTQP